MSITSFASPFFVAFVLFYAAHLAVEMGLILVNKRHLQKQLTVPSFFQTVIMPETFAKSQNYTLAKQNFALWQIAISSLTFWLIILSGVLQKIDLALPFANWPLTHAVLYCLLVGGLFSILALPLKLYRIFVLEQRFGFNTMTLGLFCKDQIKGTVLTLLLLTPLLYALFWLMRSYPNSWWLLGYGLFMTVQWLAVALFPTFLAPLFNRFTPLAEGELKQQIEALAKQLDFRMAGLFTVDGSTRSQHANAYFAGMGRWRRIVLFDTLVKQLSTAELVAVLAHEMGHNVKQHVFKGLLLSATLSLLLFYVLQFLLQNADFFMGFGLNPSLHVGLVLFVAVSGVFLFPLTPLFNALSRKHEYEADAFAAATTKDSQSMQSALLKLTRDNLSQLSPHPWYSFFHYSHPTTEERLTALQHQIAVSQ